MDPHPTPFPGKLRPSANSKMDKGEGKISKEPSRPAAIASRHRRDRVFGTVRSTNTRVGKPPQDQTRAFKQPKPSAAAASKKLPTKTGSKEELIKKETAGSSREDVEDAARKPKSEPRKAGVVRFQDRRPEEKRSGEGVGEDGPRTPVSSVKPSVLPGTPFYSAKSCSQCRFDRLESAPYWLNQIKLAESVEKHFVSAAFFRLALECNAESAPCCQPIRSLKSEIKRYLARHSSLRAVTVWKELCRDYGLLNEDLSVGVIVLDPVAASSVGEKEESVCVVQKGVCGDGKDGCLGSGFGGIPQSYSSGNSTKDADSTSVELNGNTGENPNAAVIGEEGTHENMNKPAVSLSEDYLMIVENPSDDPTPVELSSNAVENPSTTDSTPVELNSNAAENPSTTDSTPVKLDTNSGENPSTDSTPVELDTNTGKNPSVDSAPVELNSNTGKNSSADSAPVELNSNTGENLSADSTPVELNSNTGKNPSADSALVELHSNTGENPSDDSTTVELNSNTGKNPSANSTTPVELNSNTGGNLSAALNGEEAKKVVNKPTVSVSEDSLMVERTDGSSVNECANDSSVVVTPGETFLLEKSERSSSRSPKDSSSVRKKVHPRNLSDTSNKTSVTSQAATGSCGERVDKSKDESTVRASCETCKNPVSTIGQTSAPDARSPSTQQSPNLATGSTPQARRPPGRPRKQRSGGQPSTGEMIPNAANDAPAVQGSMTINTRIEETQSSAQSQTSSTLPGPNRDKAPNRRGRERNVPSRFRS